ncbi:MAG: hypothetical protein ABSH20_10865 [Tepidisphaeraceae bacterium]
MTATADPTRLRLRKLLAIALDPAAVDGEAENAGVRAVKEARRLGLTLSDFFPAPTQPVILYRDRPEPADFGPPIQFGKYKGESIRKIARDDPDYLEWVLENCERLGKRTRSVIEEALEGVST